MLLLAIAIVTFFVIYQKRLLKEQRRLQKAKDDYQRQLLNLSITVQEKERIRIGQDMHDEIGSSLSAIKMLVNQLPENDPESDQLISGIKDGLSNTISDVRTIANNLFPSVLTKFGLADALQYQVNLLSAGNILAIDMICDAKFKLNFDYELAIYRILQELINNVIKHANAKSLFIRLNQTDESIFVTVKDDGCGFDTTRIADLKQAGIGIKSVQTRIAAMQAVLKIASEKNKGTVIEINIPLHGGEGRK
nr:sensor histidine kinase [Mucilaginibacter sp. Bleaf8]